MKPSSSICYWQDWADSKLVTLYIQSKDERVFNTLLLRHKNTIYSYILNMTKDENMANDIFQETFKKVLIKTGSQYNEQGKWIYWVMRIAHNMCVDYMRRERKFVDVEKQNKENEREGFFDNIANGDITQYEKIEKKEIVDRLQHHIFNLSEDQRQVILLRHYYDMSFKEIAELTNVSVNTVLGRMRYAVNNLRKVLNKESIKNYSL